MRPSRDARRDPRTSAGVPGATLQLKSAFQIDTVRQAELVRFAVAKLCGNLTRMDDAQIHRQC
jgi:hypothetical protein